MWNSIGIERVVICVIDFVICILNIGGDIVVRIWFIEVVEVVMREVLNLREFSGEVYEVMVVGNVECCRVDLLLFVIVVYFRIGDECV